MLRFPFQVAAIEVTAVLLAAGLPYAHAQVITPAPKVPTSSAQNTSVQPPTANQSALTDAQASALNAEAKQNTGKACNLAPKKALWTQKTLATATTASGGTVGDVIPMPAKPVTTAAPSPQLQVAEQFLSALEKLTGDYSSVVKLGHSQSGKWALVRDRDNLTNIYFAVSQGSGQMTVKFCELQ